MASGNPFKHHRFSQVIILLAERGIIVDAVTVYRWVKYLGLRSANAAMVNTGHGLACNGMWMIPTSG